MIFRRNCGTERKERESFSFRFDVQKASRWEKRDIIPGISVIIRSLTLSVCGTFFLPPGGGRKDFLSLCSHYRFEREREWRRKKGKEEEGGGEVKQTVGTGMEGCGSFGGSGGRKKSLTFTSSFFFFFPVERERETVWKEWREGLHQSSTSEIAVAEQLSQKRGGGENVSCLLKRGGKSGGVGVAEMLIEYRPKREFFFGEILRVASQQLTHAFAERKLLRITTGS